MENLSSELTLPVELLGLNDIEIEAIRINENNEIIIHVKSTKVKVECHRCGKPTRPYGKGQTLRMRHLPILGKKQSSSSHHLGDGVNTVIIIQQRHKPYLGMIAMRTIQSL